VYTAAVTRHAQLTAEEARQAMQPDGSRAYVELLQIARALHREGRQVVGLWPASPIVPVPPLAVRLAVALQEVSGSVTAAVDGNLRWPATSIAEDSARVGEDILFATRWLSDAVALVAPRRLGPAGAGIPQLRLFVRANLECYAYIVIDLSGYERLGDHLDALEIVDGMLLVARAGVTTEDQLLRMVAQLPAEKNLGVILVG